jgi:hypothetical protein
VIRSRKRISPSGDLGRDNVFTSGGGISTDSSNYRTNDHNLNASVSGKGNITGRPIFVGGKKPTSHAGYRLAPRSRGKERHPTAATWAYAPRLTSRAGSSIRPLASRRRSIVQS